MRPINAFPLGQNHLKKYKTTDYLIDNYPPNR